MREIVLWEGTRLIKIDFSLSGYNIKKRNVKGMIIKIIVCGRNDYFRLLLCER